jgi:hypothetical protein
MADESPFDRESVAFLKRLQTDLIDPAAMTRAEQDDLAERLLERAGVPSGDSVCLQLRAGASTIVSRDSPDE